MSVKAVTMRLVASIIGGAILAGTVATAASASTTAPYIREGSRGAGVLCAQLVFIWTGIAPNMKADGIDGPQTTAALKTFQHDEGLAVDGVIGPATGSILWQILHYNIGDSGCYAYLPTRS
jgi:peptidoglycan hydrolase-like protein with peptidoglycan-binding domain